MVSHHNDRCLDIHVSPACLDRALRIMDTVLKALAERNLRFEITDTARYDENWRRIDNRTEPPNMTRVLVEQEWIGFGNTEGWSFVRPPMPKQPKGLSERELERWVFLNKPRAEKVPNGRLALALKTVESRDRLQTATVFREHRGRNVEDCLNRFVAQLYIMADTMKRERVEAEQRKVAAAEEAQRRYEEQQRQWRDKQRLQDFQAKIQNWRLAKDLREFVEESYRTVTAGECTFSPAYDETLKWALEYADRIDPIAVLKSEMREIAAKSGQTTDEGEAETTSLEGGGAADVTAGSDPPDTPAT